MATTTFAGVQKPLQREQFLEDLVGDGFDVFDAMTGGYVSISLAGLAAGNYDLTPTQARNRVIRFTGNPAGAQVVRIPDDTGAVADPLIVNACGGASSTITVKSQGANAGNASGVSVATGVTTHVRHDGESVYAVVTSTPGSSQSVLGSAFSITGASGVYQDTGLSISLPAAGTYLIAADVRTSINMSAGTVGYVVSKFHNSTDAADVANSETILNDVRATGVISQRTSPMHVLVTVTAVKTIKLYAARFAATTWTASSVASDADGRTRMSYLKLA